MELKYLNEFVVLVKVGNFQRAAEQLYISQSSLSKHIKSIESELGAELIDRSNRTMKLTEFGHLFLSYAQKIVDINHEFSLTMSQLLRKQKDTIAIGAFASRTAYNISGVIAQFGIEYPDFDIKIIEDKVENLLQLLRDNEVHMIFIHDYSDVDLSEFNKVCYMEDTLAVVLPASHPLAGSKYITLDQLRNEIFIQPFKSSRINRFCQDVFQSAGFEPLIAKHVDRYETLIDLVAKNRGISLGMKKIATYFSRLNPTISIVELSPRTNANIVIVYRDVETLPFAAQRFLEYVSEKKIP